MNTATMTPVLNDFYDAPVTFTQDSAPYGEFPGLSVSWIHPANVGFKAEEEFTEWLGVEFAWN